MWKTIRKLFRKIFDFLSISGDKAIDSPETKQKFIKVESKDFDHSDSVDLLENSFLGKEPIKIGEVDTLDEIKEQIDTKHYEHKITEIDDSDIPTDSEDGESGSLVFQEDGEELDEVETPEKQELFEVDSSIIEEEKTTIESHFFDEPPNDADILDSDDVIEVNETVVVDEVVQVLDEEEALQVERPLIPKTVDKKLVSEIIDKKVMRKRKRKFFYYDVHPIPVLADEKIEELIRLAEAGMLKGEFGYDSKKLEIFLLNAYKHYDLLGEIPFGRKSFEYFCDLIQQCYIKNSRTKITQVPPALFVASMVFCARYSEEEARNFWKPYANIVWKTESHQYFQYVSRKHFVACKFFLQKYYDFIFPIINDGDVVRPVYYQAVIPYYLQSNFAEWLVDRFEQLLDFSIDDLPHVLQKEKSLDYVPPRLRNFVQQSETSDTAAKLIQQMAKAVRLFQSTEQYEAVNSVMSSPIERSLWKEIHQDLIEKQLKLEKIRKYTPKLEWVWDLDNNDINLLLSQVRASRIEKPNLVVWAKKGSLNLSNEEIILDVYPWQLSNGDWELEPELISDKGDLDGKIFVLSEEFDFEEQLRNQDDHVIIENDIPELKKNLMFFFISSNRSIAREKEKINGNGDWIILSKESIEILDHASERCVFENIYIPQVLREKGFNIAKKYSLTLPVILQSQSEKITFQHPQTTFVLQADLMGKKQILGLSQNIQPIYQSPNVKIRLDAEFPKHQLNRIWVSIYKGGVFINSVSLAELQKQDLFIKESNGYIISLREFIYEPGSYSVSILHDLQLLIEENLRFAYLPEIKIVGPDPNICYSPANPLEILINGINQSQIKTGVEEKVKIAQSGTSISLLWKELRFPECRFSLQWKGNNIHFGWDIDRVSAWIDGGGDKRNFRVGHEKNVILHVRGEPKEEFIWFIDDTEHRRKVNLDSQGEYCRGFNQSVLRDLLKSSRLAQSKVSITIRDHTWEVFVYNKIPILNFKSIKYEKPYLSISLSQSERLEGDFTIQIRDKERPIRPIIISRVKRLEENIRNEINLLTGKYQTEILLGNEILAVSQVFIVKEKIIEIVQRSGREIIIKKDEDFSSKKLFSSLTSDYQEILSINETTQPNLISILNQLIRINSSDTWVTREKLDDGLKRLLPSWAVLQYPLRFRTEKHNRIFHIFPQQTVFGGIVGKGYMSVKLEHDPVKIYAAWNTDLKKNKTCLWVMIPQVDSVDRFCDLDEYDLWPGYQCVDCGIIVGSKNGNYLRLSPQTSIAHKHNKSRSIRDQFLDVVYDTPIEVKVSQYQEKKLSHCYWPNEIVGDNYFNDLCEGKMRSMQGDINIPIDTFTPKDYYIAISEAYQNYKNPIYKMALKQIIGKDKLFEVIKSFILEKKDDVPAFSAILRLDQNIVSKQRLFFLPKYILLLSLVLRLKANNPQIYKNLQEKDDMIENEVVILTFQSMKACPKLLEWSIAWAEIVFNHAIS